ncbi:DUF4365 domain-containing protein [Spirobacillus cienkowskii]|uniref:DUF4365 domain-containing protein n=1 Tax=Spirobacillus cienkowskii TaxID=495820 RepID=UPI0030CF7496
MEFDDSKWKEKFSEAYIYAITAQAGWKVAKWSVDEGLVDATIDTCIKHEDGLESPYKIDLQLKCTESPTTNNETFISYTLKKDRHIENIKKKTFTDPFYFILFNVPKEKKKWVEHEKDVVDYKTILKYCAYYYEFNPENNNLTSSKTIRFEKKSIFDVNFLDNLIFGFNTYQNYSQYKIKRLMELEKLTTRNLN